jgi:hypothetical protein
LGNPQRHAFGELLIDAEDDRTLRAVLVGMLREGAMNSPRTSRPWDDEYLC